MGQSTNAYLAFGIDLGEDVEWPNALSDGEDYPDLDAYIAKKAGLVEPTNTRYQDPEWHAYFLAKEAAAKAFPLELESHCSGDYPMWVLCLRNTLQMASRGETVAVKMREIHPDEIALMKAFCEEHGLAWSEPDWLIFSYWG